MKIKNPASFALDNENTFDKTQFRYTPIRFSSVRNREQKIKKYGN